MFEGRAMEYRQIQIIGGQGNAPGRFATTLRGLAVDAHGQLYAAGDSGITVFDQAGSVKRRWATSRPPLSVAVASDGAVYAGEEPVQSSPVYCAGCTPYLLSSGARTRHSGGHESTHRPHPLHSSGSMITLPRGCDVIVALLTLKLPPRERCAGTSAGARNSRRRRWWPARSGRQPWVTASPGQAGGDFLAASTAASRCSRVITP